MNRIIFKLWYGESHWKLLEYLYGHGQSSHDKGLYYIDKNADYIIGFINNIIKESTVVGGYSNGEIKVTYVAAYGGELVSCVVLEDPPTFSTQGEG